jgi:hypothetical protein
MEEFDTLLEFLTINGRLILISVVSFNGLVEITFNLSFHIVMPSADSRLIRFYRLCSKSALYLPRGSELEPATCWKQLSLSLKH